ncbi:unnamed protein product [Cuscuta campestris]|uniref:Retrotransposon Copia-like N-terminal domain-containing protein n=1 Tax=Cuscuta campestris TaxID=132261 RepID=A0A484LVI3_9ASTE|nr:unnamed protein product [Cuscuta campestris]
MADEKVEKTEKPVSRVFSEEEEIGEKQVTKISPYELRSSDTPALVITQIKLTGDNYEEWARAMRIALRAKRKFGFIDGSIPLPEEDEEEAEEWWIVNAMLVSWIFNTIDGSLRNSITQVEEAAQLWNDIKERFSVANGPRINQLKRELANCRQNGVSGEECHISAPSLLKFLVPILLLRLDLVKITYDLLLEVVGGSALWSLNFTFLQICFLRKLLLVRSVSGDDGGGVD